MHKNLVENWIGIDRSYAKWKTFQDVCKADSSKYEMSFALSVGWCISSGIASHPCMTRCECHMRPHVTDQGQRFSEVKKHSEKTQLHMDIASQTHHHIFWGDTSYLYLKWISRRCDGEEARRASSCNKHTFQLTDIVWDLICWSLCIFVKYGTYYTGTSLWSAPRWLDLQVKWLTSEEDLSAWTVSA